MQLTDNCDYDQENESDFFKFIDYFSTFTLFKKN